MGELKFPDFKANHEIDFKDGDDGDSNVGCNFTISVVENGYILSVDSDEFFTEVYIDKQVLLDRLKDLL